VVESGWRKITCAERDAIYAASGAGWCPGSALTDIGGQYGDPTMFTEWWDRRTEVPMLRDRRWLNHDGEGGLPDARPCEHYAPEHVAEDEARTGRARQ
jgi:hypothetical protein